jgi:endonuclease YncB( thermonuclease family)
VFGVCLLLGFAKGPYSLQRDYYYQIYRALEEAAYKEGRVMRKNDLQNQCMWQHQNDLRKADKENRLIAFLKGKASLQ